MKIQQAKDLYDLADEGEEKTDAKLALKRELQKEVAEPRGHVGQGEGQLHHQPFFGRW